MQNLARYLAPFQPICPGILQNGDDLLLENTWNGGNHSIHNNQKNDKWQQFRKEAELHLNQTLYGLSGTLLMHLRTPPLQQATPFPCPPCSAMYKLPDKSYSFSAVPQRYRWH